MALNLEVLAEKLLNIYEEINQSKKEIKELKRELRLEKKRLLLTLSQIYEEFYKD